MSNGPSKSFIGFMVFVTLTKYNEIGENMSRTLATEDNDDFDNDEIDG